MKIAETLKIYCLHHSCNECELVHFCALGQQVMNTYTKSPISWKNGDITRINKSFEGYEVYDE